MSYISSNYEVYFWFSTSLIVCITITTVAGSPACNMSAKEVIHVNSPSWGSPDCQGNLEKAVRNILDYADKQGMTSVAIPSIGSGQ